MGSIIPDRPKERHGAATRVASYNGTTDTDKPVGGSHTNRHNERQRGSLIPSLYNKLREFARTCSKLRTDKGTGLDLLDMCIVEPIDEA